MKSRIAILASGSGTTAEAFIRAGQRGAITTEVGLVICSRRDAGIFQRVEDLNAEFGLSIEVRLINSMTHPATSGKKIERGHQTMAEQKAILEILQAGNFDAIALMGYMRRVGPQLIEAFGWRPGYRSVYQAKMLNTHPGLLPATKAFYGERIQQYVLEHHLPHGGQTLHLVSEEYDDGPIIAEHRVPVKPDDTAESLFARVQAVEKRYLPRDIEGFIEASHDYNKSGKE